MFAMRSLRPRLVCTTCDWLSILIIQWWISTPWWTIDCLDGGKSSPLRDRFYLGVSVFTVLTVCHNMKWHKWSKEVLLHLHVNLQTIRSLFGLLCGCSVWAQNFRVQQQGLFIVLGRHFYVLSISTYTIYTTLQCNESKTALNRFFSKSVLPIPSP